MPRLRDTIKQSDGRNRLRLQSPIFVTDLITMEKKYMAEGKWDKALECIGIALPYCLPKLSSIEIEPNEDKILSLLREIQKTAIDAPVAKQLTHTMPGTGDESVTIDTLGNGTLDAKA